MPTDTILVAIDPTDKTRGALAFASWLREAAPARVLDGLHLIPTRRGPDASHQAYIERASAAIHESLAALGVDRVLDRVDFLEAADVADGLHRSAVGSRAVVLGRRARSGERTLVHLGPVARRLLRSLPAPVIVVPPDLTRPTAGRGPVVFATDLQPHSEAAARFALEFARDHGCPFIVTYVGEPIANPFADDSAEMQARAEEQLLAVDAELTLWADAHGLAEQRRLALCGSPVETLLDLADDEMASLLVLGSRRLTLLERVFTTSIASTLAAYAPCPVAVVPPD
jgi:nucleotide-binding universal stress UspA family protein